MDKAAGCLSSVSETAQVLGLFPKCGLNRIEISILLEEDTSRVCKRDTHTLPSIAPDFSTSGIKKHVT